jgi:hypothetical protein
MWRSHPSSEKLPPLLLPRELKSGQEAIKEKKALSYYPPYKKYIIFYLRENLPLSIASNDKWRLKDKDLEEKTKE